MSLLYTDVSVGDVLVLHGRRGNPDQYTVVKKYGNRIVLLSHVTPGYRIHHMENQFDASVYNKVSPDDVEPIATVEEEYY